MNSNIRRTEPCPLILHIPHSSKRIPEPCKGLFYLTEKKLEKELLCMTDSYTDELFDIPGIPEKNRIVFPYSRLICDVERFKDDRLEPMAARGMGICYSTTSKLKPLKAIPEEHRNEMYKLYDRHHAALTEAADRIIESYGYGIVIDCHSFASRQLFYESEEEGSGRNKRKRRDICIGTDSEWHTPAWLRDCASECFMKRGYDVAFNDPFSGTLAPMKYYHQDRRLLSIMIEVNRRLYMDESTGEKTAGFETLRKDIRDTMAEILAASEEKMR